MNGKTESIKSQSQMQSKRREFIFVNLDDHDIKEKIVFQKYHSVCWYVVANAWQLIYSGDKDG
jgi:hypothetical protein